MISKRLLVLKKLTAHLEPVTFEWKNVVYPMTKAVYRGRTTFGDETKVPFISILEKPRQLIGEVAGIEKIDRNDDWDILIQGFAPDDKKNPLDPGYEMLAAVEQRFARLLQQKSNGGGPVYPDEFLLGLSGPQGIVTRITFTIPIVRPPDNDVSDTAYFYMPVSIGIKTDMAAPFTEET